MIYEKKISVFQLIISTLLFSFISVAYSQEIDEITASEITKAIEMDLILDDFVSSHLIDVSTADGIVTLSGSVRSLFEKERSEKISASIKGVRSVVNKINVEPKKISNDQLKENISLALLLDPVVSSYGLEINVNNGVATLKGEVSTWSEMELAANVVKNVAGVKKLNNNVNIVYDENISDLEIKRTIDRKLNLDPYVDESFVSVMVSDGEVKFDGTVGSAAEKNMLIKDAWVTGVKSVNADDINILFWANNQMKRKSRFIIKSDEEIREAVKDAMLYDPRVSTFDIEVNVESGYVTLDGIVDNLKAKRSAYSDAENTIGVIGVENKIKVRPSIEYEDIDIGNRIEQAFELDPILDYNNLQINVVNNKAYLYGTVRNYSEKVHATNVASLIMGVVDVENNIDVLKKWNYKADRVIKEDIEDELFWSFLIDSDDINVTVENGVATLTGEVGSLPEYKASIENAFEGGAKRVMSKLDIESNSNFGYRLYYPNYPLRFYAY